MLTHACAALGRRKSSHLGSAVLVAALVAVAPRVAAAYVCFSTPVALPGLSGPPQWNGTGVVRTELNEPRWAGAPLTSFDSDLTGTAGLYRLLVDDQDTELTISVQAPTDLGSVSGADAVYFGFTTDGLGAGLAKAIYISVGGSGTDPAEVSSFERYNYDVVSGWTASLGALPSWMKDVSIWRNNAAGDAAWGVNFKVSLQNAGLSVDTPFKMLLAMHKQDENDVSKSVNLSTPQPGANSLVPNTLFIADPAQWAVAFPIDAGCGGIALKGDQIRTRNALPTVIDTTNGAVNHFYVTPTIASGEALYSGLFSANFHLSNWSTVAAPDAPWKIFPNGAAVQNGAAPAPNDSTVEFVCPPNTATTTCGIPTPTESHQAVYVELQGTPSNPAAFKSAAAYADMQFACLGCAGSSGNGGTGGAPAGGAPSGGAGAAGAPIAEGGADDAGSGGDSEPASGGASGKGGAASGGSKALGGSSNGDAGAPSVAGTGAGGSCPSSPDKSGCSLPSKPSSGGAPSAFALLALAAVFARRRRRTH